MRHELVVIGGGIVGLATAYRYLQRRPGAGVVVLEKERAVGTHQSGRNSGVLHAGLYYAPGSAKAILAREGMREMIAFCSEHAVPHEICGKLVVATTVAETGALRRLHERGEGNGLRDLRWLTPSEAREIEPHVGGVAALHVPEEGIVDFPAICKKLAECIRAAGGIVATDSEVLDLRATDEGWAADVAGTTFRASHVVNCAGVYADRVARMAGEQPTVQIVPFRGEYFLLRSERQHLVRNLIYPVPDPAFPFLGVHLTRRCSGEVEVGPNAVLAPGREAYSRATAHWSDLLQSLRFPGLTRFVLRYPRATMMELVRSGSRGMFTRSLQRLVPSIRMDDLDDQGDVGPGIRAQAMRRDGTLVQDFELLVRRGAVHVLNAPSPAATASLAIGSRIVDALEGGAWRLSADPASA